MTNTFPAMVAWDPSQNLVAKNVQCQVYATSDTGLTTPLTITDHFGNPVPNNTLNSGNNGILPEFQQPANTSVVVADSTKTYRWTVIAVQPPTQDGTVSGFITSSTSSTAGALRSNFVGVWQPNTSYTTGQVIVNPTGDLMHATANFTSPGTWSSANWAYTSTFVQSSSRGAANGVASLDANGLVPLTQLPASAGDFGRVYFGFTGNGTYLEKANVLFSPDGHRVTGGTNNPVFADAHTGTSFRDPSLLKVGSTWFAAYTVDNGSLKNFAVIKSTDFVNWTTVATVDVSAATSINQCWAPELVNDGNGNIYAFFTNVTAANAQSIWYVQATDATGLTTWGAPTALSWATNPGNIWDATFTYNASNSLWYMFYAYAGYIQRAYCSSLIGTWTTDKTGDWAGWQAGVGGSAWTLEAPEVIQEGSSLWRMYFDPYNGTQHPGYYWSESTDFTTWTTPTLVSKPPSFPPAEVLRHGAWVKLTTDTDRNLVIAACEGGLARQPHSEFNGTTTGTNATVVNVGSPAIVAANTNNDQFVTCSGSGIFVPAVSGIYDIRGAFSISGSSGVTRTFAQLTDAQNADSVITRSPGAAEDTWQLNIPGAELTGGHQYRVQVFQNSSQASPTINCTIAFTYRGRQA